MFTSLSISNFRNLDELSLNSLRRVNLITGKNNTGKSSLLEAVAIYACNFDLLVVDQMLEDRGENYYRHAIAKSGADATFKAIRSLFTRENLNTSTKEGIEIRTDEIRSTGLFHSADFVAEVLSTDNVLSVRIVTYLEDYPESGYTYGSGRRKIINDDLNRPADSKIGLEVSSNNVTRFLPIDDDRLFKRAYLKDDKKSTPLQFIRPRSIDRETNGQLWDSITLTPKEASVVEALRIIDSNIERITFVNTGMNIRSAVVKLKNVEQPMPLRSMGDGINRILTIILALVNAENGYLLIDEFENGLHHSVQTQLWKMIFQQAEKLNVQVFASTHSDDCIAAFENALNHSNDQQQGKLIRLTTKNGKVQAVDFDANALKIAVNNDIEVR